VPGGDLGSSGGPVQRRSRPLCGLRRSLRAGARRDWWPAMWPGRYRGPGQENLDAAERVTAPFGPGTKAPLPGDRPPPISPGHS